MIKFIKNLQFLFRPNYWVMNNRYSKEWNELLNHLMDNFEPVLSEPNPLDGRIYTVRFDKFNIWVENYPYAYGTPYEVSTELRNKYHGDFSSVRPSRLTILKLRNLVKDLKLKKEYAVKPETAFKNVLEGYLNEGKNA